VQLAGQVRDVGLVEIFRLLAMGSKTGVLKVTSGRSWGSVHFDRGRLYFAISSASVAPLGERLVRSGHLSRNDLTEVLAEHEAAAEPLALAGLLLERELVPEEDLRRYLREQIEDAVFNVFSWPEAEFEFESEQVRDAAGIFVGMDAEAVVMEGCRRLDEWRIVMERLGSLEKVPHLSPDPGVTELKLRREEWELIALVDGRRDVHTIVADSGMDRFRAGRLLHGLVARGLAVMRDPTLELLGQRPALAVLSPIDIYNLTFLTTACTSDISHHIRMEETQDAEFEVHLTAGVREDDQGGVLLYFSESRTPASVIKRMALETSGFIALVNVNSRDAVQSSRRDIGLLKEIGDKPYVAAAYASLVDEKVTDDEIRGILELPPAVPLLGCSLRDPEEVKAVVARTMELVP
jgi:hypothetical protein